MLLALVSNPRLPSALDVLLPRPSPGRAKPRASRRAMPADSAHTGEREIDWNAARRFLRRRLELEVSGTERQELDDLVQEACVNLLRAVRRESARDLEGLMTVIARRTHTDFVRRRIRARRTLAPAGLDGIDAADPRSPHDDLVGELHRRLELIVLELFQRHGAGDCQALARAYFAEHDWAQVARELGMSHEAVRKRWSRCLEVPRRELAADPQLRRVLQWNES
jgi:RNA polymerase sigma factor (sigma-70 family)